MNVAHWLGGCDRSSFSKALIFSFSVLSPINSPLFALGSYSSPPAPAALAQCDLDHRLIDTRVLIKSAVTSRSPPPLLLDLKAYWRDSKIVRRWEGVRQGGWRGFHCHPREMWWLHNSAIHEWRGQTRRRRVECSEVRQREICRERKMDRRRAGGGVQYATMTPYPCQGQFSLKLAVEWWVLPLCSSETARTMRSDEKHAIGEGNY